MSAPDSDVDDRRVYAAWAVPVFGFFGIVAVAALDVVGLAVTPSFVATFWGTVALATVAGALPTPSAPL
ncbi:hypothetical protein [Halogeometricum luteum]|uniref:Uncharacterized protein n=1 Tax=Halogeometricum luteum TaxID=2950537 RepID=A0ABU2G0Z9_9EURY|nr:hypothetical protein [Halogeometricum sp. S3BR5-2]MDS0294466.1 hypothetical protein [Halogeometricum sp. S3BR5-2]